MLEIGSGYRLLGDEVLKVDEPLRLEVVRMRSALAVHGNTSTQ